MNCHWRGGGIWRQPHASFRISTFPGKWRATASSPAQVFDLGIPFLLPGTSIEVEFGGPNRGQSTCLTRYLPMLRAFLMSGFGIAIWPPIFGHPGAGGGEGVAGWLFYCPSAQLQLRESDMLWPSATGEKMLNTRHQRSFPVGKWQGGQQKGSF